MTESYSSPSHAGNRVSAGLDFGRGSYAEQLSRSRRLADVKRGVEYSKMVNSMATSKWNAHGGISLKNTLDGYPLRRFHRNLGNTMPTSKSIPQVHASQLPGTPAPVSENHFGIQGNYNTWGSRTSQLDRKLVLCEKPRRGVVMSRVTRSHDTFLKTKTDFRSRNGTIRIVEPLYPIPHQRELSSAEFDPSELEREQTYAMLKRIDGILHPQKVFFKSQLSTSEEEILSGGSCNSDECRSDDWRDQGGTYDVPFTGCDTKQRCYPRTGRIAAKPSSRSRGYVLASTELDPYRKCEIWVNRCQAR